MDDKYVSLATFESAMMHLQQTNKRLSIRGNSYADPHRASYAEGYSRSDEHLRNQIYSLMNRTDDSRTKDELRRLAERV